MAKIHPHHELPSIFLAIDNYKTIITPENTTYTQYMLGKVAFGDVMRTTSDFDHIHIRVNDSDEDDIWVFRPDRATNFDASEGFRQLSSMLLHQGYPVHANITEVDDEVLEVFRMKLNRDAGDDGAELVEEITEFLRGAGGDK